MIEDPYSHAYISNMKKASMLFVVKNLKWLMGEKISPYALALATGVPQPTIFRILTGESEDPRTRTLQPLAEYFGVAVADLRDKDLSASQNEHHHHHDERITNQDSVALDAKQHAWLSLLDHLGSDDVEEFAALIRARQERNIRFIEEMNGKMPSLLRKDEPIGLSLNAPYGKKQRSQSSS